jgi:hypothetical protein
MGARADIYFEDLEKKAEYNITITEIVARLEHIHTIAMDLKESKKVYSKIDALLYDIEEARIKEDEEGE